MIKLATQIRRKTNTYFFGEPVVHISDEAWYYGVHAGIGVITLLLWSGL